MRPTISLEINFLTLEPYARHRNNTQQFSALALATKSSVPSFTRKESDLAGLNTAGWRIKVFRKGGAGQFDFLAEIPADGFNWEVVRNLFGGGEFRLTVVTRKGRFYRTACLNIYREAPGAVARWLLVRDKIDREIQETLKRLKAQPF